METLVANQVTIRLSDTDGKNFYLAKADPSAPADDQEESKEEQEPAKPISVPITVVFN